MSWQLFFDRRPHFLLNISSLIISFFSCFLRFWEPLPPLVPSGLRVLMSPSTANHEVFYHPFLVFPNPARLLTNAGDPGSIPRLGRSLGEGNSNPLQCSCLRNPMDRRSWQATVHWGHERVGHDLATTSQQQILLTILCVVPLLNSL